MRCMNNFPKFIFVRMSSDSKFILSKFYSTKLYKLELQYGNEFSVCRIFICEKCYLTEFLLNWIFYRRFFKQFLYTLFNNFYLTVFF